MKTLSLLMPCTKLCNYTASYKDIYDHFTFGHQHSYSGERPMHDMFTSGISFILKLNINNKVSIMREHGNSLLFSVQCFRELYGVYVKRMLHCTIFSRSRRVLILPLLYYGWTNNYSQITKSEKDS